MKQIIPITLLKKLIVDSLLNLYLIVFFESLSDSLLPNENTFEIPDTININIKNELAILTGVIFI